MKKDIYIIRNTINSKCYIGQSKNAKKRFKDHLNTSKDGSQELYVAMREIGVEKFYLEILENQVEDFNEKEKHYISLFKTLSPNGYNMTDGGEGYPHQNGVKCYQSKVSSEDLELIIQLLKEGEMTQTEIALYMGLNFTIINNINNGKTYYNKTNQYPIQTSNPKRITKEDVEQVCLLLKDKTLSYNTIAKKIGCDKKTIQRINLGLSLYTVNNNIYPIREERIGKLYPSEVEQIICLLQDTDDSTQQIAEIFKVSRGTIEQINQGKSHFSPQRNYPIRKHLVNRNALSKETVFLIKQDLKNTSKSLRQIARERHTTHSTITGINNGKTKKHFDPNIKYPIRKR